MILFVWSPDVYIVWQARLPGSLFMNSIPYNFVDYINAGSLLMHSYCNCLMSYLYALQSQVLGLCI